MAVRDLALSRGASTLIFDPNLIHEHPTDNTRDMNHPDTIAHIREMADAIINNGNESFPPITIYQEGESINVMAGWCRRRAHIIAMNEGAPVKGILCLNVMKKKPEDLALSILTSNDGLPLTALEKSKAVKRLQSFMWTVADIAKRTGWSLSTVNNLIALHDVPESIKSMVSDGSVSATLATRLVQDEGAEKAAEKLESAVKSAKESGKKKATQKDVDAHNAGKIQRINFKLYGPKLLAILKAIYECPINDKAGFSVKIADAGDLLSEMQDKYGEMED